MSKSPLVMLAALLGAGLISSAAVAQTAGLFAGADCREAKVDRVIEGKVLSSDPVIICKRTDQLKAALQNDGIAVRRPPPPQQARGSGAGQTRPDRRTSAGPSTSRSPRRFVRIGNARC